MNYTKIVFCMKLQQKNQKEKDFTKITFQGGIMDNLEKRVEKLEYKMFRQWRFNWLTNLAILITTINVLILAWAK